MLRNPMICEQLLQSFESVHGVTIVLGHSIMYDYRVRYCRRFALPHNLVSFARLM